MLGTSKAKKLRNLNQNKQVGSQNYTKTKVMGEQQNQINYPGMDMNQAYPPNHKNSTHSMNFNHHINTINQKNYMNLMGRIEPVMQPGYEETQYPILNQEPSSSQERKLLNTIEEIGKYPKSEQIPCPIYPDLNQVFPQPIDSGTRNIAQTKKLMRQEMFIQRNHEESNSQSKIFKSKEDQVMNPTNVPFMNNISFPDTEMDEINMNQSNSMTNIRDPGANSGSNQAEAIHPKMNTDMKKYSRE